MSFVSAGQPELTYFRGCHPTVRRRLLTFLGPRRAIVEVVSDEAEISTGAFERTTTLRVPSNPLGPDVFSVGRCMVLFWIGDGAIHDWRLRIFGRDSWMVSETKLPCPKFPAPVVLMPKLVAWFISGVCWIKSACSRVECFRPNTDSI